jgi:Caspase domain
MSSRYALLIGVGECQHQPWSLPVTVKDMQAVYQIIVAPDFCGYPQENVHLLHDETATRDNILEGLAWLKEQASLNPECTILIYYSGHGWLDLVTKNYYLIPHDVAGDLPLANTALSAEDFTKAIQEIKSQRVLVVIDSCYAQGMAATKEITRGFEPTAIPKSITNALSQGKGRAVFTSCDKNEKSWIRRDALMSIYTYHFIEALQGAGNLPDDTVVRLSHLMNYLGKTVPQTASSQFREIQTPNFDISNQDFAVSIALLRGGKGLPPEGWNAVKDEAAEKMRQIIQAIGADSLAAGGDIVGVQGKNTGNVAMGGSSIHTTSHHTTSQDSYTTNNQGSKTYNHPIFNQQGSTNYHAEGGGTIYSSQGSMYNSQGGEIHVGDRITYHQVEPTKTKATFAKLVKGIAKNFTYLEQTPPFDADDIWKILKDESGEGFEKFDLAVFKLVASYCCYYCNRRIPPSEEYRNFGEMDYFERARQFRQQGKLSACLPTLSSIIKSRDMAELIRGME